MYTITNNQFTEKYFEGSYEECLKKICNRPYNRYQITSSKVLDGLKLKQLLWR